MEDFLTCGAICSLNEKEVLIGWGKRSWSRVPLSYPVWFAPDFFLLNKEPYLNFARTEKVLIQDLKFPPTAIQSAVFTPPDWAPFEDCFLRFKRSGLEKVVPYVQKKGKSPINTGGLLNSCLNYQRSHPSTAVYGFWDQEGGMLGVTPECLLIMKDSHLKSVACAGTASLENAAAMLEDAKLLNEHQWVIQGLKEDLERFGQVRIGTTEVKSFSKLAHLMTPVEVSEVKGSFNDLIAKMHPSPALGAYPKEKGLEFLKKYEVEVPRKRFGAPFGVLEAEDHAIIHVAIRNIQWEDEEVTLYAGCGIIAASSLEEEKKEIEQKLNAIHEIVGI